MLKPLFTYVLLIGIALWEPAVAATPIHKCQAGTKVTYQSDPCPSARPRRDPNVNELNAERKRKAQDVSQEESRPAVDVAAKGEAPTRAQTTPPVSKSSPAPEPTRTTRESFKCDGRTYCSQMTSCAEAKLFLANCPESKMDGDKNGIPCEQQWCSK